MSTTFDTFQSVEPVAARVARGVEFLDADSPGWRDQINLKTLNVSTGEKCVLGQVYGNFLPTALRIQESGLSCSKLGFVAALDKYAEPPLDAVKAFRDAYTDLTREWRRVIHESRVAVPA